MHRGGWIGSTQLGIGMFLKRKLSDQFTIIIGIVSRYFIITVGNDFEARSSSSTRYSTTNCSTRLKIQLIIDHFSFHFRIRRRILSSGLRSLERCTCSSLTWTTRGQSGQLVWRNEFQNMCLTVQCARNKPLAAPRHGLFG